MHSHENSRVQREECRKPYWRGRSLWLPTRGISDLEFFERGAGKRRDAHHGPECYYGRLKPIQHQEHEGIPLPSYDPDHRDKIGPEKDQGGRLEKKAGHDKRI